MKLIIIYFIFGIAFINARQPATRIIGGKNAENGQFPHQVSLIVNQKHHCGGSIIAPQWVLTSAYYMTGLSTNDIQILAGTPTLNNGGTRYSVSEGRIHGEWNPFTLQHDIALLKTNRVIVFNDNVKPIPLNTGIIEPGTPLVLSGWGSTQYPVISEPNNLQYITLNAISLAACREEQELIFETQLCTLNPVGQGACRGDSGSPLIYKGQLVGIVSWGRPCALGRPDVFTDVSKYLEWIFEMIME